MKILVIDNAEPADRQFNQPLFDFITSLTDCDIVNYTEIPTSVTMQVLYSAVIVSGVPLHYSFESVEQRLEYYQWIHHAPLPVLGICLGHQLIGKLFGGEIIRDLEAESGMLETQIIHNDPLFVGVMPIYESFMMHRASVTVPKQFKVLARTAACSNVIMKHKRKGIYGLQAHPELSPNGTMLVGNFIALARTEKLGASRVVDLQLAPVPGTQTAVTRPKHS